jgi:hypothetical protein
MVHIALFRCGLGVVRVMCAKTCTYILLVHTYYYSSKDLYMHIACKYVHVDIVLCSTVTLLLVLWVYEF